MTNAKKPSKAYFENSIQTVRLRIAIPERMETETGQIYWNGELKRSLSHLEGVDERYRESDQRQLAELNTRNK